jgi:hypothetical protein
MKVVVAETVAAAADQVFAVIGNFAGLEKNEMIVDFTVTGSGVGAVRSITLANGGVIDERLEQYDPQARSFTYAIINQQNALPVANYAATVVVTPLDGNSSTITWSGVFEPVGISEAEATTLLGGIYKGGIARTRRRLGL